MRIVPEIKTYANQSYALVETTKEEAEAWARKNVPTGWHLVGVTRYRKTDTYTAKFRRGANKHPLFR
jgi:hypothetical protein